MKKGLFFGLYFDVPGRRVTGSVSLRFLAVSGSVSFQPSKSGKVTRFGAKLGAHSQNTGQHGRHPGRCHHRHGR